MMLRIIVLLSIIWISEAVDEKARHFSLFSVVTFKNEPCQVASTAGITGVCMTKTECTDIGQIDGNCASGFGSCCLLRTSTCGTTISRNCTYVENPGYPTATTQTTACSFPINQCQESICQIRLDFTDVTLQQPAVTAPFCTNSLLTITPGTTAQTISTKPPVVCGGLTGQHMYLDSGRQTLAATLAFTFSATAGNDIWRIKVTQIECRNPNRAPQGCLQYFHGGNRHTVKSFNWDGTNAHTTGGLLGDQQYAICFRREKGMCGIQYGATQVASTLDAFEIEENALGETGANCANMMLTIPNNIAVSKDRFCGGVLNRVDGATDESKGGVINALPSTGFTIHFTVDETTTISMSGFSVDAQLQGCTSGFVGTLT